MRHSVEGLYEIKEDHVDLTTDVKNTTHPLVNDRNKLGLTRESFLEVILVLELTEFLLRWLQICLQTKCSTLFATRDVKDRGL